MWWDNVVYDRMAELYCINHFRFSVQTGDLNYVVDNPLSPYKRFGIMAEEATELAQLFGFISGAIAYELGRYMSEFEFKYFLRYLDNKLKKKVEEKLTLNAKGNDNEAP